MAGVPPEGQPGSAQPVTIAEVQKKIDQLYGDRHDDNVGHGLLKGAVSVGGCQIETFPEIMLLTVCDRLSGARPLSQRSCQVLI